MVRPRATHEGSKSHNPSLQADNPYILPFSKIQLLVLLSMLRSDCSYIEVALYLILFIYFSKSGRGPCPPPPSPSPCAGPEPEKKNKRTSNTKKKYKTQAYQSRCSSWKPSRKARIAWDFSTLFTHQQGKKRKWRHVKLDFRWLWQAAHF